MNRHYLFHMRRRAERNRTVREVRAIGEQFARAMARVF